MRKWRQGAVEEGDRVAAGEILAGPGTEPLRIERRRPALERHGAVPGPEGHRIAREAVEGLHVAGGRAFVRGRLAHGTRVVARGRTGWPPARA